VSEDFNNVLIAATTAVPEPRLNKLQPWDMNALCGYEPAYLAGFRAQRYQIELAAGFEKAKAVMANEIGPFGPADIGGDEQRVMSISTTYSDIYFPASADAGVDWGLSVPEQGLSRSCQCAHRDVEGERPYSAVKIGVLVLAILVVLIWLIVLSQSK